MSNALNQWSLVKRINWPQLPKEMSVSQLLEIEDCPLRWLLEHADYPEIWNRHGYPRKISLPALNGLIIHSCIEIIIGELINAGCHTLADSNAVNVMKHLGGYSNIIQSTIEQSLKYYEGNPRTEGSINSILSSLRTNIPDLRSKVQLLLGRIFVNRQGVHFVRSNIIQPDKIRSALPFRYFGAQ